MGGDNFNKNSSESGNNSKSDADLLLAAINAGKKHRQSTPERLEKEAMKQLNALVDKFIDTYSIVSGIEKAATEGKTFLEIAKRTDIKCDFDTLFWGRPLSNTILSVVDKGGSGLSTSKTILDFGLLLRKEFSPAVQVRFQQPGGVNSFPDLLGGGAGGIIDLRNPIRFVYIYWD